jgi:hypothetical protein
MHVLMHLYFFKLLVTTENLFTSSQLTHQRQLMFTSSQLTHQRQVMFTSSQLTHQRQLMFTSSQLTHQRQLIFTSSQLTHQRQLMSTFCLAVPVHRLLVKSEENDRLVEAHVISPGDI